MGVKTGSTVLLNRGTSNNQGVDDRCGANLGPAACGLCCLKEREPAGSPGQGALEGSGS